MSHTNEAYLHKEKGVNELPTHINLLECDDDTLHDPNLIQPLADEPIVELSS